MFEIGDRVRCIEVPGYAQDVLSLGRIYTITHLDLVSQEPMLGFGGEEDPSWFSSRFELVEENPAPGYMELFI